MHDATIEARLWARVDRNGPVPAHRPELGPCWLWLGHTNDDGYGTIRFRGRSWLTHRVAWVLSFGEVTPGKYVLHHCDNPPCVNPAHLYEGTQKNNMDDMFLRGRARPALGDKNGSRLHPELLPRGDAHHARVHPECMARGEQSGQAKLTEEQVRAIRRCGGSSRATAALFSVSGSLVKQIRRGTVWRHVH